MKDAMIELRDIRSQASRFSSVGVESVSLTVPRGQSVAVVSDRSAALSQLFEIVALLDHRWSGEYFLDGQAIHMLPFADRREIRNSHIGCICPASLVQELSVAENIEISLSYRGVPRSHRRRQIEEILDNFGMADLVESDIASLTPAQRVLAATARVAAAPPAVVLASDPTTTLGENDSLNFFKALRKLGTEGATILLTTASPRTARFADQIVYLQREPSAERGLGTRRASSALSAAI